MLVLSRPIASLSALTKFRLSAHALRLCTVGYAFWVLWQILLFWTDAKQVVSGFSKYLGKDLGAMADWQRWVGAGLDLFAWTFLLVAVAYAWQFLSSLKNGTVFTTVGARGLIRCAVWGLACQLLTLALRPLISFVMSVHLAADEQVYRWSFHSSDLLGVILCFALLVFALVYGWALEIADENKGFV